MDDCRAAAVTALKYEGRSVMESAFRVLGEVAMRGLFSNPATIAELQKLDQLSDRAKWNTLYAEAGVAVPEK